MDQKKGSYLLRQAILSAYNSIDLASQSHIRILIYFFTHDNYITCTVYLIIKITFEKKKI